MAIAADVSRRGRVTVLTGPDGGTYPYGNSVLVDGEDETALIDPSLGVRARVGPDDVDRVILSHVHEDHVAGLASFPDAPVHAHRADVGALASLEAMVDAYGLDDPGVNERFGRLLVDDFDFVPRPDARPFSDGEVFDLGGSRVEVLATPGHTPGHCCLLIQPEAVLYLGDIDLSGFGPYYADRHSSLDDFVAAIERCRHVEAEWYVTFHHKGTYTDRAAFIVALDRFEAAIERRDQLLLEHLAEPRTLAELVQRRILYRPHVDLVWVDAAERHTIERHLARLQRWGVVTTDGEVWARQ